MDNSNIGLFNESDSELNLKEEFYRYFSFWPYYVIVFILFTIFTLVYLKYSDDIYRSSARIEIIDKSQDSEMALPTAMTIFNRSMINLENEIGVLNSYSLNKKAVEQINANIKYYSVGRVKTNEQHYSRFFNDYELTFNIDTDTITKFEEL